MSEARCSTARCTMRFTRRITGASRRGRADARCRPRCAGVLVRKFSTIVPYGRAPGRSSARSGRRSRCAVPCRLDRLATGRAHRLQRMVDIGGIGHQQAHLRSRSAMGTMWCCLRNAPRPARSWRRLESPSPPAGQAQQFGHRLGQIALGHQPSLVSRHGSSRLPIPRRRRARARSVFLDAPFFTR